jgi:hypothetical protein
VFSLQKSTVTRIRDAYPHNSLLFLSLFFSLFPSPSHIRVIKVAKDFVGRVSFAVSSKSEMSRETDALGLDSDAQVTVGIYDSNGKYAMAEDFR